MPGKRIPALTSLTGANSANNDEVVIFDTDADETKRITRAQLAAGLVGDLPYTPAGFIAASTVPTAIAEIVSDLAAAGGAALIGNTPAGTIAATTVQGAINEIVSDLAASSGSSLVGFLQAGTSAAARTVQAKLRDVVNVKDFGAVGDGVADDTAAVQAALNTGKAVYFPDGTYAASGLSTGALNQKLFGSGRIVKNGNGPLLSSTHSGLSINDLYFSGTGYTGDNLSFTGTSPTLINVTSENAAGRAFKSTKSSTVIIGGHYRTSDNTASGYDIEFGDGVNSSLYNFIDSMSTNQSFGGVLCQTADLYANNCQIGKLDTTGSNSAKVFASRIIDNISLSGSGSVLSGCGIAANVTLNAGTSKCALVNNDYASGSVIVNNGNGNNFIETNVSAGSRPIMQYGPSSSDSKIAYDTAYTGFAKDIYIATGIRAYSANTFESATVWGLLTVGALGQVTLGTNQSFVSYLASSTHQFIVSSVATAAIDSTSIRPEIDGTISNGTVAKRWSDTYSTNFRPGAGGPIWTSAAATPESAVTAPVGSLFARTDGVAGTTLYVKESGTGNTGWANIQTLLIEDTAANIAAVGNAINTAGKYKGKLVWDTTNTRMMRASGSAAADPWVVIDGSASVTPS